MSNVFNENRNTDELLDYVSDFSIKIGLSSLVLFSIINIILLSIQVLPLSGLYTRWTFICIWILVLLFFFLYKGRIPKLFKLIIILSVAINFTLIAAHEGTIHSDELFWLALPPIGGGLVLQKHGVTTGFLLSILGMITLIFMHSYGCLNNQPIYLTESSLNKRVIILVEIILFMTVFSYLAHTLLLKLTTKVKIDNTTLKHLLNTISTKIETNISEIKDIASDLQRNSLTNIQTERLSSIYRASNNIQEITKNLKVLKQIDQEDAIINFTPVNAISVIDQVNFIYSAKLKDKGINLIIENSLSSKTRIWADKTTLNNQIINNFISNAIKFSWKDHNILLKFEEVNEYIQITISDSGIGIPTTLLKNLFSIAKRTSRKGTAGEGGTGFGMPIAKSSIEDMGGSLLVKTRDISTHPDSSGTSFVITLKKASILKET